MAVVVPPKPTDIDAHSLEQWHNVFKTPWETLVGIGYVTGAAKRMFTQEITGLLTADGEVQFFGEDVLEPELHNATLTTNATFYAVSLSASDTGVVKCWMIDENGDEAIVDKTLTGTTPVSIGSYVHCNMMMYLGSATQNVGSLFVSTKSDAGTPLVITNQVQLHIGVSRGHGNNPRQKCPNNQVMIFDNLIVTCSRSDGVHVRMHKWVNLNGSGPHKMLNGQWLVYQTSFHAEFVVPFTIQPGEEIDLTVEQGIGGGAAVSAAVNWGMYTLRQDSNTQAAGADVLFIGG